MNTNHRVQSGGQGDLPPAENPVGSLMRAAAPFGTGFKRKTIMILTAIICIVVLSAVIFALQEPKKKTATDDLETKQTQKSKSIAPDEIKNIPSTYSTLGQNTAKQQAKQQVKQENPLEAPASPTMPYGGMRTLSSYASPYGGMANSYISPEMKEYEDARKSGIAFANNSGFRQTAQAANPAEAVALQPSMFGMGNMENPYTNQHPDMTDKRLAFVEKDRSASFYLKSGLQEPISQFTVMAGTIIPGVMLTGINSQLPGQLIGQVRENVYDTVTGNYLLIPQGARVIGVYDSRMAAGQNRVLIVWTRLIMPNGQSIDLESMQGTDAAGYTGLADKVNNHTHKLINGVLLSSIFAAAASLSSGDSHVWSFGQRAAYGASDEVSRVGTKYAEKMMDLPPTIEIRPGMKFNIMVNKDMLLEPYVW